MAFRFRNRTVVSDGTEQHVLLVKTRGVQIVAVWAIIVVGFFFLQHRFWSASPGRDSPDVVLAEERAVFQSATSGFESDRLGRSNSSYGPLARPLRIKISGKTATLTVANRMETNLLQYAASWYEVYHKYHDGTDTVCMRIVWKTGDFYQPYPLSDIGWFVPKCPIQ